MSKLIIGVAAIILIFVISTCVWLINGSVNATTLADKMDCKQLRDYVNYSLAHRYDTSVITDSHYAIERLTANCLS